MPIDTWNRRAILTERGTEPSTNQTVCATSASQSEPFMQQGLAVRVRRGPGDRQRAVTLTKNTFTYYYWVFNVLTWDTRRSGAPYKYVAQFDMSDVVRPDGELVPLPWRTCLRVHGTTVRFKVWLPNSEPETGVARPDALPPGRAAGPVRLERTAGLVHRPPARWSDDRVRRDDRLTSCCVRRPGPGASWDG